MNNFVRSKTLINESAMRQTANRLQVRGGIKKQAEIISTVNKELCDYLYQFKGQHISIEQLQNLYKMIFPKLEIRIICEKVKGAAASFTEPYTNGEYNGPFKMQFRSRSILDIIKSLFKKTKNNSFYINSRFVDSFIHENTHLMQCYMKPAKKVQQNTMKRVIQDLPVPAGYYNTNVWLIMLDVHTCVAFKKYVDGVDSMFYNPENFIKNLRNYFKSENLPDVIYEAYLKYCIRSAEMENQAYQEGILNGLRFKFHKLSEKPFFDNLFKKIAYNFACADRYENKIDAMKQEYYIVCRSGTCLT